jgi:hypothetical protein
MSKVLLAMKEGTSLVNLASFSSILRRGTLRNRANAVLAAMLLIAFSSTVASARPSFGARPATNSSLIAVDGKRGMAFVPLLNLNDQLHGEIAVVDLNTNPDVANPLIKIIDIGLVALPRATAVDIASGTVFALADNVANTGNLLMINESDFSITTVPLPVGSRPNETSGIVFDPQTGTALVSMSDSVEDCTQGPGGCTGMSIFDPATQTFSPLSLSLLEINGFGLNQANYSSIATSDDFNSNLLAFDLNSFGPLTCELDDQNVIDLLADPDGVAVDPATGIWVLGNFESPTVSIINLNGSQFMGLGTDDCHLEEGGTPPNSVNLRVASGAAGMPGVAINPNKHKAFVTGAGSNLISLVRLPATPMKQINVLKISHTSAALPANPLGLPVVAANFPYGTVVDSGHNFGYFPDEDRTFLARVDLARLSNNPIVLSTALLPGSCAGVSTASRCNNGKGIRFFPLFSSSEEALARQAPQFGTAVPHKKRTN